MAGENVSACLGALRMQQSLERDIAILRGQGPGRHVADIPSVLLSAPGEDVALSLRALREVLARLPEDEAALVRDPAVFCLAVMTAPACYLGERARRAQHLIVVSDHRRPARGRECMLCMDFDDCAAVREEHEAVFEEERREDDEAALADWRGFWAHELGHAFCAMRGSLPTEGGADWWAVERGFEDDLL